MELAKFLRCGLTGEDGETAEDGFIVVNNKGDSMEKLIMDGARVVIDTSSREIISGGIYALTVPREGLIIRECHSGPEGLILKPYNRNYPAFTLGWDRFSPEAVVGKVYCSIMNVFR